MNEIDNNAMIKGEFTIVIGQLASANSVKNNVEIDCMLSPEATSERSDSGSEIKYLPSSVSVEDEIRNR